MSTWAGKDLAGPGGEYPRPCLRVSRSPETASHADPSKLREYFVSHRGAQAQQLFPGNPGIQGETNCGGAGDWVDQQEWIRRCQTGDVQAFEPVFRAHIHMAVRTAFLITRDWAAAEDAAQEAFVRAFRAIRSFRLGRPFAPWLYRIVVNEARRAARRINRPTPPAFPTDVLDQEVASPESLTLDRERRVQLWAAIHGLDEDHRVVLTLKYLRGFTAAEVATVLGLRPSTVKSRLYVARQRLLAVLGPAKGAVVE